MNVLGCIALLAWVNDKWWCGVSGRVSNTHHDGGFKWHVWGFRNTKCMRACVRVCERMLGANGGVV